MFGEPLSSTYYNSLFVPPPETEDSFKFLNDFPKDLEDPSLKRHKSAYWRKLYSNDSNIILIPQKYEFMHTEIMVPQLALRIK